VKGAFVSLDVIGAGFGRTGTLSLSAGLEELGFDPCYHFTEVIERRPGRNEGHRQAWVDFAKGRRAMDWRWLFTHYRATVDFPMCLYYPALCTAFPEARVVLTVRDPGRWFESFDTLAQSLKRLRFGRLFAPKLRATTTIFDRLLRDGLFGGSLDRASCIAAFERHRDAVVRDVPADRLLVYEVGEGWGPLCRFLDVAVPATPFPHLNEGEALDERMTRALLLGEKDVFGAPAADGAPSLDDGNRER
jgi:hypothetical protein